MLTRSPMPDKMENAGIDMVWMRSLAKTCLGESWHRPAESSKNTTAGIVWSGVARCQSNI